MPEYIVKVEFDEKTLNFSCPKYQDIISATKEKWIDLPSSCFSAVRKSCTSRVIAGLVEQNDAMVLNDDLHEKGFALLRVAYPKSDFQILIGDQVEDNLYNNKLGKYQK